MNGNYGSKNIDSAIDLKSRFEKFTTSIRSSRNSDDDLEGSSTPTEHLEIEYNQPNNSTMSNGPTREEMNARLEASEARVATAVESMRTDAVQLRSEMREGLSEIKAQGREAQVAAEKFYARANEILARIDLSGERNKTALMGLGYKVAAWIFGAIVACGGLSLSIYKAVKDAREATPQVGQHIPAAQPSAPSDQH